jgi:hypothetical protein
LVDIEGIDPNFADGLFILARIAAHQKRAGWDQDLRRRAVICDLDLLTHRVYSSILRISTLRPAA